MGFVIICAAPVFKPQSMEAIDIYAIRMVRAVTHTRYAARLVVWTGGSCPMADSQHYLGVSRISALAG